MNIDNWPLDRIMRLPDWCFGRRWWVGLYNVNPGGGVTYSISDEQLPDRIVVWGVMVSCRTAGPVNPIQVTLRLGDRIPVSAAEALTFDRILKGMAQPAQLYELFVSQWDLTWMNCERIVIESAGKRLVVVTEGDAATLYQFTAGILISAMPKEVPDWLISGSGKNLL